MASTPAGTPPGPASIGRYQILSELGRGAMGRVYRAFDPNIGRHIALKAIPLEATPPELAQRFRFEAQAAGILSHPNIVTIYDAGQDGGFLYIAMELVKGPTLQELLAPGPLPLPQVISFSEQVAAALDHAHAHGIIHRDIKPANLMLQGTTLKVADFGVAKSGAAALTSTGQLLGTPQYLAPEVVKGAPADARSDIFAFGAVLYEMLTGRRAFGGDHISNVIYRILSEQPPPPSQVYAGLPRGVDYVVRKALAKEPAERYASGAELVADLKDHRALEGRVSAESAAPSPPPPFPSLLEQTAPWPRESVVPPTQILPAAGMPAAAQQKRWWSLAAAAGIALLLAGVLLRPSWIARQSPAPETPPTPVVRGAGELSVAAPSRPPAPPKQSGEPAKRAVPDPGKPSAFGSAAASSAAAGAVPALPAAVGRAVVHTEPAGARILINGEPTSYVTPVNFALRPGSYRLTLERDGYERVHRDIAVEANRTTETRLTLPRKRRGFLRRLPFLRGQ
ncbi:MAG TPA: serine/threonine-protein kinase [Terriglobia bacterium]|nr:serine/threonine-protein kinase [Terriglobia bacterium]